MDAAAGVKCPVCSTISRQHFPLTFSIFPPTFPSSLYSNQFSKMTGKVKSRKTVSFQSSTSDDLKDEVHAQNQVEIPFKPSALLVPFHLPIILAYIYDGLLKNPKTLLIQGLPTLIAAQLAYGILITKKFKNNKSAKKKNGGSSSNNTPILLIGALIISVLLSVPLFIVIIVFGAPLYGLLAETFLLSVHLSLILFYPILVSYKLDFAQFLQAFSPGSGDHIYQQLYKNQLVFASIGGVVGAWFGVLTIPLDWDRDWQQWPITILIGGYIGTLLGNLLSLPLAE